MVLPRSQAPELSVPTVGGAQWTLSVQSPENFTLVVVYRGLHCPICKMQLRDLERKLDAFAERGVNVVAVSTDSEDKATQSKQDWGLDKLTLGYGLSIETAREWGLFISTGIKQEPAEFSEPGLFLIRPGGEVYFVSVQSMPFARPPLDDVLSALDFVLKNDYPARGELAA